MGRLKYCMIMVFILFTYNALGITPVINLKIGGDESQDDYFDASCVAIDEYRAIYISDMKQYQIIKYDVNGRFVKKAGKKGQGPGEFASEPQMIKYFDEKIYVVQKQMPIIQVFTTDLVYKESIKSSCMNIKDFVVVDGTIYITAVDSGVNEGSSIVKVNDCLSIRDTPRYVSVPFELYKTFAYIAENNTFVVTDAFQDRIQGWSKKNVLLWETKIFDGQKIKLIKRGGRVFPDFPNTFFYKSVNVGKNGVIYILSGDKSDNPRRDVYVLSKEGRYQSKITLPFMSPFMVIDTDNQIYSLGESEAQIIRSKMPY